MATSSFSDSDEDWETLRRIQSIVGVSASDVDNENESSDSVDRDYIEDHDYLQSLKKRFSLPSPEPGENSALKPVDWIVPVVSDDDDDDDQDHETLLAIQRRFNQYNTDASEGKSDKLLETETSKDDISSVHGTNDILSRSIICTEEPPDTDSRELLQVASHSQFPKSAQNYVNALKRNRACQRFIRNKLMEIEGKVEENKELKRRVKCLADLQIACKKNVGRSECQKMDPRIRLISMQLPAKVHNNNKIPAFLSGPRANAHVSIYKMVMKRFPVFYSKPPWSNIEKEKLTKGLKQQYQETLLLNALNSDSDMGVPIHVDLISAALSSDFEVTPERIRLFFPLINWDRLASMYLPGRSGAECESRWLNCEDPLINHRLWTVLEDKKLLFIVQERGIYNWIDIATALGTQRTPFQCLARYQRSLNPHILNRDWTEDEDAKLRAAVDSFGDNWQIIASNLEGRTGTQCSNRWKKTLLPDRRRVGKWSLDEDKHLKAAVMLFEAKNWNKIAQFVPGRTQSQCRERWVNVLDPHLNLGAWSGEEDAKLLAAIDEHGRSCWSRIARCVPPRTDNQCRRRWKVLRPYEVPLQQKARQLGKKALISNFVDREIERPAIGPNDFLALPSLDPQCERNTTISKKKQSCNRPKKPRAKFRRSREETSTEIGTEANNETLPSAGTGSARRARKKASRGGEWLKARKKASRICSEYHPQNCGAGSGRSLEDNMIDVGMIISSGEVDQMVSSPVHSIDPDTTERGGVKRRKMAFRSSEETSIEVCAEGIDKITPNGLCLGPAANANAAETGKTNRARKKAPSGKQLEKSRIESRSFEEASIETGTEGTNEIAPSNLLLVPSVHDNTAEIGCTKRIRKKASSGNQLKMSKTTSRILVEIGAEGNNEITPPAGGLCLVPGAKVNTIETGSTKRRKKASRNNQRKEFRIKCRQFLGKLIADDMTISSSEIEPTELPLLPDVDFCQSGNSKVTLQETSSSEGLQQSCSEETKYSKNDVFIAEDVPLITWLDTLVYEARSKRLSNKMTSGSRASN